MKAKCRVSKQFNCLLPEHFILIFNRVYHFTKNSNNVIKEIRNKMGRNWKCACINYEKNGLKSIIRIFYDHQFRVQRRTSEICFNLTMVSRAVGCWKDILSVTYLSSSFGGVFRLWFEPPNPLKIRNSIFPFSRIVIEFELSVRIFCWLSCFHPQSCDAQQYFLKSNIQKH